MSCTFWLSIWASTPPFACNPHSRLHWQRPRAQASPSCPSHHPAVARGIFSPSHSLLLLRLGAPSLFPTCISSLWARGPHRQGPALGRLLLHLFGVLNTFELVANINTRVMPLKILISDFLEKSQVLASLNWDTCMVARAESGRLLSWGSSSASPLGPLAY